MYVRTQPRVSILNRGYAISWASLFDNTSITSTAKHISYVCSCGSVHNWETDSEQRRLFSIRQHNILDIHSSAKVTTNWACHAAKVSLANLFAVLVPGGPSLSGGGQIQYDDPTATLNLSLSYSTSAYSLNHP